MLHRVRTKLASLLGGDARSVRARKNIIASLFIKGGSIVVGFMVIPITLHYLDKESYGVWITMSSFLTWLTFFEIGLGSGLKNKLAESLAVNDKLLAKKYVSTTYALLTIVVVALAVLFVIINPYIPWHIALRTDRGLADELTTLALILFSLFSVKFVLKLIGDILQADQRSALNNLLNPIGNALALVAIWILSKTTEGSLLVVGLVFTLAPALVLIFANFYFFRKDYRSIAPTISHVDFSYGRRLFGLGARFFIIQISALILFQSANFVIIQFFGPAEVTQFNIAYKYFSALHMVFTIVMGPYWSAFTEAWVKQDFAWIRRTIRNLTRLWGLFVIMGILMLLVANLFFEVWIGKESMKNIHIGMNLQIALVVNFLLFSFGGIYTMFINGVGKITMQLISLALGAMLFVPMCYVFVKVLGWGVESVIIASILSNFYSFVVAPIQYNRIISGRAYGVWNS